LSLAGITQGAQGLLSVGLLQSGTCTIGDYVIDWYLNSVTAPIQTFASKNSGNINPTASQVHPFVVPSQSGTWIPVIRYIDVNGVTYSPTGGIYNLSQDLATCLTNITITSLTCPAPTSGQPFYSTDARYSHYFLYNYGATSVAGDANKTLSMELNADGSTKYLAWYFYAYRVSDRIKFSYVSPTLGTTTLLEDYVVGLNVTTDLTANPRRWNSTYFRGVLNLNSITYNTGDRVLIEIIGNYVDPTNAGTDWFIYLKCLSTFSTAWAKTPAPIACSTTFAEIACNNQLYIDFPSYNDNTTTDLYKYLIWNANAGIGGTLNQAPTTAIPRAGIGLAVAATYCYSNWGLPTPSNPNPFIQPVNAFTFVKTGANLVMTFTNDFEYNLYRDKYIAAYDYNALTYSSDPTNINHYKFIFWYMYTGTPESVVDATLCFHQNSTVTFVNDGTTRTITINMVNANGNSVPFTPGCVFGCNLIVEYTWTQQSINYTAYYYTSGSSSYTVKNGTGVYTYPVRSRYQTGPNPAAASTTSAQNARYADMYLAYVGTPTCVFTSIPAFTDWYTPGGTSRQFIDYKFVYKLTITNSADPLNNFKLEDQINPATGTYSGVTAISTIYEKIAGIVTTPSAGCP
jgi:hypothetical protein